LKHARKRKQAYHTDVCSALHNDDSDMASYLGRCAMSCTSLSSVINE